jgi:ANTAR domain
VHTGQSLDGFVSQVAEALTRPVSARDAASSITQAAVDLLPGVDCASVTVIPPRADVYVIAPTDPLALEAERLEQELSEGPTQLALATGGRIDAFDVAADPRWLLYGPKVAASGLAAQVAAPLHTSSKSRAALNLYARSGGSLERLGVTATLFVSHAAVAWCGAVQLRDLSEALDRRKVIGQAIGVVMERYGVAEEAAFAFMTRASQTGNVKLRDIAAQIVAGVELARPTI